MRWVLQKHHVAVFDELEYLLAAGGHLCPAAKLADTGAQSQQPRDAAQRAVLKQWRARAYQPVRQPAL